MYFLVICSHGESPLYQKSINQMTVAVQKLGFVQFEKQYLVPDTIERLKTSFKFRKTKTTTVVSGYAFYRSGVNAEARLLGNQNSLSCEAIEYTGRS